MSKPKLIMLVGLAGSGKSTYAKTLSNEYNIHSSDSLREEMFGDVNENSKECNEKLFVELHRRIKSDLRNGNNVIYDATNLNRKRRITFLRELKNINCFKTCVLILAPYYVCIDNNSARDRKVPDDVIKRMYMNFQPPHKSEGWDDIEIIFSFDTSNFSDYKLSVLYNHATGIDFMNQGNEHHSLTLGEHCRKAASYIHEHYPEKELLYLSALLHDEGKVFTMTAVNSKGERDGNCHYYQHHCVGSYDSIFYMYNMGYRVEDLLYVANLVYYHMSPYREWKNNERLENKMKSLLGDNLYSDIIALHDADKYAH